MTTMSQPLVAMQSGVAREESAIPSGIPVAVM